MTTRRDGYDINRWIANAPDRRARSQRLLGWLLAALAMALAAPVVALLFDGGRERGIVSIFYYLPLMLGMSRSPFARDTWATRRGLAVYDEFERDALAHATRRAYGVLLALGCAAMAWMWAAPSLGWPVPNSQHDWSAWGLTFFFVGVALPVIFAEWMVPFPPEGDEMEE